MELLSALSKDLYTLICNSEAKIELLLSINFHFFKDFVEEDIPTNGQLLKLDIK